MINGKAFYGHKIVLSLTNEKFKSMFCSGMMENNTNQIELPHIRYDIFSAMCRFLYTGEIELSDNSKEGEKPGLDYILEMLTVADEFMIDEIKLKCEKELVLHLNEKTFETIFNHADMCGAF